MKHVIAILFISALSTKAHAQQIQIRDSKVEMLPLNKPLYIIDGNVMPDLVRSKAGTNRMVSPVVEINSTNIESVTILKGESAFFVYGEAGKNGVVKIALKKNSSGK